MREDSPEVPTPGLGVHLGIFLVALTTLHHEIILTRIFSVTLWYHYAFLALSLAMFGMTAGAIRVHLKGDMRPPSPLELGQDCLLFAGAIFASLLTQLSTPMIVHESLVGLWSILIQVLVIAVPFYFSGIVITRILTGFADRAGRLYAADLTGAACGCFTVIFALDYTDGPSSALIGSLLAVAAAGAFLLDSTPGDKESAADERPVSTAWTRQLVGSACIMLVAILAINTIMTQKNRPLIPLVWVKGQLARDHLYERWNSFSRIRVWGDPDLASAPFGWGFSTDFSYPSGVRWLHLDIDSTAATPLTHFDGNVSELEYLENDVTNVAHFLRRGPEVLVVGVGGGRDILSALSFGSANVTGVEMNEAILECLTGKYGEFTGHLDRLENVKLINEDARSYVTRQTDTFDMVQVSMVDTWAATAAGAFVLTENALYTTEGWQAFIRSLTPGGLLSFSRWYDRKNPGEIYRLVSLASQSLRNAGVENPSAHLMIARVLDEDDDPLAPGGVGTLILSRQPFDDAEIDRFEIACKQMGFDLILSPRTTSGQGTSYDPIIQQLVSGADLDDLYESYPLVLEPPTDDRPFFFNMLKLSSLFESDPVSEAQTAANYEAVHLLCTLALIVFLMAGVCIVVPLAMTRDRVPLRSTIPDLVYFLGIGFGFMLIEVAQMQRFVVFLGHPTRSLSVVLSTLLLGTGVGSLFTAWRSGRKEPRYVFLGLLLLNLALFGVATPLITARYCGYSLTVRIGIVILIMITMGFTMGMAFPVGFARSLRRHAGITPLLWGVNGAGSIAGSVLSVLLALTVGISVAYWVGVACYAMATLACYLMNRPVGSERGVARGGCATRARVTRDFNPVHPNEQNR